MIDAKMQIVRKLNSVKGLTDTFIRTSNGYKVTNPEGYVAIDRIKGNAVKLVDRMEFSFNNFTALRHGTNEKFKRLIQDRRPLHRL